ncbi:MAG TPA: peptidylprolyl isomerase [Acidimicrobiia bacterium]
MKKFALLTMASALVLTACGAGSGEFAASVDDTEYTVGDVNELVFDSGDTVSKDEFAQYLGFLIQWDIVVNAAEADYGIEVTEEEIDEAAQGIYSENAEPDVSFDEFLEVNMVSVGFISKVAQLQLIETAVRIELEKEVEPPTQEDLDAQRQLAYEAQTEVCVSHILVETEAEAQDVLDRIDEGEDFEDIAAEVSLDTGSGAEGGDLGCSAPSRYVPGFMEATLETEVGEYSEPVESEFGFHIIIVNERTFPADEDLPTDEEITEALKVPAVNNALTAWINGHLETAEVEVNEKFGTWQTNPAGVVPPVDPDATTTTISGQGDPTSTTVAEPTDETTTTTGG